MRGFGHALLNAVLLKNLNLPMQLSVEAHAVRASMKGGEIAEVAVHIRAKDRRAGGRDRQFRRLGCSAQ